ncbi:MAG: tetratricopeptide repeat protein [Chitinophagaceae bacterium]|nr:MAG: tetratricopeptide repeat protein [Chitinophagaceae bacterium]
MIRIQPSLRSLVLLLLGLVASVSSHAQNSRNELARLMKTYHDYHMFDGAVLVARNDSIIYQDAFGLANREWDIPNRTDTKFMIGSVSKPLTATLALIQVKKGLLRLDSTLAHYLPAFRNKPAARVTVRQLLAHTSGIANYDIIRDFFPRISRQHFDREAYLKVFIDSALVFTPGTRYAYSSWGYFTLGYLMEQVSGKSYAQLMNEDIFQKLGMSHSGSYDHKAVVANRATGYDYTPLGYASSDFRDQSNTMGTGDLYSTVGDLFKFHRALAHNTLLDSALTAEMFRPGMAPANYGLGWFNKPFKYSATDSVASNFHLGMTDGFISFIRRIPASNTMVVILCNSSPTDFFGITNNLLKALQGQAIVLKEPVHKKIESLLGTVGAAAAVMQYRKIKADTARYSTDWISMNFLAQQLLDLKRTEDARIISEENVVYFGDKDLVQVTMGNIYLALNRKEEAIACYRKALAISPGFDEARVRLRELTGQ